MTITNGYITLANFKKRLDIDSDVTTYDTQLEEVAEGVSRAIDNYCNTRFYVSGSETKYYTPIKNDYCDIDFNLTITSLKTDDDWDGTYETTWTLNTDYFVVPRNNAPYYSLEITHRGNYYFTTVPNSVQVIGTFGYATSPPADVVEATYLWAGRVWKRRDSPLGIEGTSQFGMVRLMADRDPDVEWLLAPYRRII